MLSLNKSRCSMVDQLNLQGLINAWSEESPEDKYFFQPSNDNDDNHEPMLYVSQSKFQRHLLNRYGHELVLMDSTYKISKYEVPLFLICVATNAGYFSVANFITERETSQEITTTLKVIKSWNNTWQPLSFMTDMDHREISAIESVFPVC